MPVTLERALEAAANSMIAGKRAPHCFYARVQGEGYINDGSTVYDRADYLKQLKRDVQSEIDNLGYAPGYAELGYKRDQPAKGVIFANWNVFPRDFDKTLEKLGYAVEWSDEWTNCCDCNRAVRTEPDSYWYQPYFYLRGSEIICFDCIGEPYADRFDFLWALYAWLSLNHGGQNSKEYADLSRVGRIVSGRYLGDFDHLDDNQLAYYHAIDKKRKAS